MQRLPRDFQIFIVAVILAAVLIFWSLLSEISWEAWPEFLLFLILIWAASMFPIPDPSGGYLTATAVLFYVLFSIHGPGAGMLIAGSAYAVGAAVSRGWVPWRTFFNGAQIGISVGLAGLVFRAAGGSMTDPGIRSFLVPFVLATLTHQTTNNFFMAFYFSRLRRLPLLPTWLSDMREYLWSNVPSILSAALLAILYQLIHPLTLLFYLVSLPLQRWAIQLYLQQRRIYGQAIDSLVRAIDADFPEGKGHSRRVADTATAVARHLNLTESMIQGIELGALLHDVGMIGLEDVLRSGATTNADARLREHVRIGAEVARDLPRKDVADIVLYHHEHFDGSGYPLGLKGAQIPIGARIVGLAEAFESMLVGGPLYGDRLSYREAVDRIKQQVGGMFDPRVVKAFIAAVEAGSDASFDGLEGQRTTEALSGAVQ